MLCGASKNFYDAVVFLGRLMVFLELWSRANDVLFLSTQPARKYSIFFKIGLVLQFSFLAITFIYSAFFIVGDFLETSLGVVIVKGGTGF